MGQGDAARRIAIVGMGPRGLGALEALAERADAACAALAVDVFEPVAPVGAGPNYAPGQSALCLLNIPVRGVAIGPGPTAEVGAFADWLAAPADPERYPARAELGRWLAARWAALAAGAGPRMRLTRHAVRIERITPGPEGWLLRSDAAGHGPYDEVLLALGQPETAPDEQLARWRAHARRTGADLVPVYPEQGLRDAAKAWTGRTVAIRGLGLSTLDALRLLTCGAGGRFGNGRYHRSGREPGRILPFSLDGRPPTPKPADAALDARFDPTPAETRSFEAALTLATGGAPDAALRAICDALAPAAARIIAANGGGDDQAAVRRWLAVERADPGAQETASALAALRTGVAMARGAAPPDAGFAVGQLWRKLQDALRRGFNSPPLAPETARALIGFDEGLKRYSYGPPVASAEELLALIDDGLVDLRAVADPDVVLVGRGWRLADEGAAFEAEAMVDAVLPSPELERIDDPLVAGLRADGRAAPLAKGLGARILPDGQLVGRDGAVQAGLCLLGRLALGSVIAVDSVHDCFGAAAGRWADGVIARAP